MSRVYLQSKSCGTVWLPNTGMRCAACRNASKCRTDLSHLVHVGSGWTIHIPVIVLRHTLLNHSTCYDRTPWTTIFLLSNYSPSPTVLWTFSLCSMPCRLWPSSSPYLLHALPLPLLHHLRVQQYLLMCTLHAPFVPASPHCYLMYHCTFMHATRPPNMCNTTPLVCALVV